MLRGQRIINSKHIYIYIISLSLKINFVLANSQYPVVMLRSGFSLFSKVSVYKRCTTIDYQCSVELHAPHQKVGDEM